MTDHGHPAHRVTCSRCGIETTKGRVTVLGYTGDLYPKPIVVCKSEAACRRRALETQALQLECPTCGSVAGQPCVDVRGIPTTFYRPAIKHPHRKRLERAGTAQTPGRMP